MSKTPVIDVLNYDPETGIFRWTATHNQGRTAGCVNGSGYIIIKFEYRRYRAHRLAYFFMTGEWPEHYIDHINGEKTDNRWINLRPATNQQNQMNRGIDANNTSGVKGLSWNVNNSAWSASVCLHGKRHKKDFAAIRRGLEQSKRDAIRWLESTRARLHGEFARND